jgi:HK97 family phage major capsid protein
MRGLTGSLSLPRNTAGPAAAWETENADADNTTATFDEVGFTPNRMAAFVQISKKLLQQSSIDVEAWVKRELSRAVAVKLETDIINGSTPIDGLLALSGTGSVAHGATGGAPTWATIVEFEGDVAVNNALKGRLGYLTNHKVRAKLKTVSKDSGSGQFIWGPDNLVNGYPVGITSLMPSDLEKSTSGTVLSGMIFGNWEDYMIAQWGGFDIIVDPYTKAKNALVEVVINSYWDAKPLQPKSFSQSVDITT